MDILKRIDKYTEPKVETFFDTTNKLMKNIDTLEHVSGGIPDEQVKKSVFKSIDMMRMQLMNIMDVINKGMGEL